MGMMKLIYIYIYTSRKPRPLTGSGKFETYHIGFQTANKNNRKSSCVIMWHCYEIHPCNWTHKPQFWSAAQLSWQSKFADH